SRSFGEGTQEEQLNIDKDFPLAQRDEVAAVATIASREMLLGRGEVPVCELLQIGPHEYGAISAIVAERRQERGRGAEQGDGAALHVGAGANAGLAEDEYSARDQTDAGEVAGIPADGDEPAPHVGADFVARLAGDEDGTAGHAKPAAAIARADEMAGVAVDVDQTAAHFGADPIARFAIDFDFTSEHLRA